MPCRRSAARSCDIDLNEHLAAAGCTQEAAADWRSLPDIASDGDRHEIEAADAAIGRIEGDPASARQVDFGPGVGGTCTGGADERLCRVVEITRADPAILRPLPKFATRPPNLLRIISREWQAWMRRARGMQPKGGGCKTLHPTDTRVLTPGTNRPAAPSKKLPERQGRLGDSSSRHPTRVADAAKAMP